MRTPTVNDEYFVRMMLPIIKKEAHCFEAEEKLLLLKLVSSLSNKEQYKLAIIGAGTLSYVEIAIMQKIDYIAIEPLINLYIQTELLFLIEQQPNVSIIAENFGEFSANKLGKTNHIFTFIFNVFAYINNPLEKINKYLKKGDILFISTWNLHSEKAIKIKKRYFEFMREPMLIANLNYDKFQTGKIYDLDCFDFTKLNSYINHKRITGNITDILIIQC